MTSSQPVLLHSNGIRLRKFAFTKLQFLFVLTTFLAICFIARLESGVGYGTDSISVRPLNGDNPFNGEDEAREQSKPTFTSRSLLEIRTPDEYSGVWPTALPREAFGQKFDNCQVRFKDLSMATCHLGAFGGNFGDMLGPDIVKRILEYRFGCSAENLPVVDFATQNSTAGPCLWSVGSVFRFARRHDHVWGSGTFGREMEFTTDKCQFRNPNITIYSMRGPHTKAVLDQHCHNRVKVLAKDGKLTGDVKEMAEEGDAGFLIPFLFPEFRSKKSPPENKSCVILHKYDEDTFVSPHLIPNGTVLLPVIQSWQTMVGNMTKCQVISSSSLHGLILADALGIPARFVRRSGSILPFKFQDYFDSIGYKKKDVKLYNVFTDETMVIPETIEYSHRSNYAKKIMATFPFHLFETSADDNRDPVDPFDYAWMNFSDPKLMTYLGSQAASHELVTPHKVDYSQWPSKPPQELFGETFDKCEVIFRDPSMGTCNLGAFGGNFGDLLGPDIVQRIVEYKFGCSAEKMRKVDFEVEKEFGGPCLWSVGSVWRFVRKNDHVWGSGSLGKIQEIQSSACRGYTSFNNVTVHSVRGPKTRALLQETCYKKIQLYDGQKMTMNLSHIPDAGDAGILIPFIFPEVRRKEPTPDSPDLENCVILHHYDEIHFDEWKAGRVLDPSFTFLPVVQPWRDMARSISRCTIVSSSSLHGIILSDAYGVPVRYIKNDEGVFDFKFQDYFSSVGRKRNLRQFDKVLLDPDYPRGPTWGPVWRSEYARKVLETFPFHLFTTRNIS